MKTIFSNKAPLPIGPYSQAVEANNLVFCSGQIGIDPDTNQIASDIETQTHQVIKNLQEVLKAADLTLESVVKTTIFLKNVDDFPKVNEIYSEYFSKNKPARATVEVSNLPGKVALIEIDAIAIRQ